MMNFFTERYFSKQTAVIALLCLLFLSGLLFFSMRKHNSLQNMTCRADMIISNAHSVFRGIFDYKAGSGKGVANITGFVSDEPDGDYLVQRTILFTLLEYGDNPVWSSKQILVSKIENAPETLLTKVLPDFYLRPETVTDVDFIPLSDDAWLVTKAGIPYLYCKKNGYK